MLRDPAGLIIFELALHKHRLIQFDPYSLKNICYESLSSEDIAELDFKV